MHCIWHYIWGNAWFIILEIYKHLSLILWWSIWYSYEIIWELKDGLSFIRDILWKLLIFENLFGKVTSFVKSLNVERFHETTWEWAMYFCYFSLWALCVVLSLCRDSVITQLDATVFVTFVSWHSVFVAALMSLWRYDIFVAFRLCGGYCVFVTSCHVALGWILWF